MKTQYYTGTSLDGFIADSNNSLDWLLQFGEPPEGSYSPFIAEIGALVMGSTTYEWILENSVHSTSNPQPWSYSQPTWVFSSRTLPTVEGADIRFVRGDVLPVYEAMREATNGKNIWIVGGGDLAGQFYDRGLLDEIIVQITPVTLGSGAPLLPRSITTPPLRLTSVQQFGTTFVELRYDVVR
jgi:dihydrofolate reductase